MPILQTYQFAHFELIIWKITEPLNFFINELDLAINEIDLLQQKYKNPIAFQQWLASRCTLQKLFNCSHRAFIKNEVGKLELQNSNQQLSISHSDDYIAVVSGEQAVGVDLQVPTPKLEHIASKYISKDVLNQLQKSSHFNAFLVCYSFKYVQQVDI